MYCNYCGQQIPQSNTVCPACGAAAGVIVQHVYGNPANADPQAKSKLAAILLCVFAGYLGVHRFYLGYTLTGLLQFFTVGGCGIWWPIDLILLATGGLSVDSDGRPLKD